MSTVTAPADAPTATQTPLKASTALRLWPGLVLLGVLWAARIMTGIGETSPTKFFFGLMVTPMAVSVLLLVWWLFASRLRTADRVMVAAAYVLGIAATIVICGQNIPVMAVIFYVLPTLATVWVGWLALSFPLSWPVRRNLLVTFLIGVCIYFQLLRLDGMDGNFNATFYWRWTQTSEQKALAEIGAAPHPQSPTQAVELKEAPGDWTAFRGPNRDGRLLKGTIATDWTTAPRKVWSHRIGPGWSAYVVVGNRIFTQEQRDTAEMVVCYDAETGTEVWSHTESTRFTEAIGGPGPRATPTFDNGRLYALGANGALLCLNAAKGDLVWKRDITKDAEAKVPVWGFSSSPLIAHGIVSVYAGGPAGKAVVGYKADTGDLAWSGGEGQQSYCSPQLSKLNGVEQILFNTDVEMFSLNPVSGAVLWQYKWNTEGAARVVQPAVVGDSDVLLGTGMVMGTRRIKLTHDGDSWTPSEVWTCRKFKPYYNDFVQYKDHIYGFGEGGTLVCVELAQGNLLWKSPGVYGSGQMLLLEEQGLLLVLCEKGDVALVEARAEGPKEVARFHALDGKTWNHPVVAHGKLYVRNGEETACFELPGWKE